ncbi:MAG: right-handed parallel beta-helix repeat-containing protein [Planctomycetaceae bacterium]|nr:right-handed parallel beta-helix repeat-containing protein [Planctomycetaceae bacterium]
MTGRVNSGMLFAKGTPLVTGIPRFAVLAVMILVGTGCQPAAPPAPPKVQQTEGPFHVYPGDDIQRALDKAAAATGNRTVIVHEGTYGPRLRGFAFLSLTAPHDGVQLIADGDVTLSARPMLKSGPGEAAIVNHILYCGDGLTNRTLIQGFRLTGTDGFVCQERVPEESYGERTPSLRKGLFFFLDGGGLKLFGQSAPVFEQVTFVDNLTSLCGGGANVDQQGFNDEPIRFQNCLFLGNDCPGTGAAIDILEGTSVVVDNCLFVRNISNFGMDNLLAKFGLSYNSEHGSGAITVFANAKLKLTRSTFVDNWNGIDDRGTGNVIVGCIFRNNDQWDQSRPKGPYELDITDASGVKGCFIHGPVPDLQQTIDRTENRFDAPDPDFDESWVPRHPDYADVGFRPLKGQAEEIRRWRQLQP